MHEANEGFLFTKSAPLDSGQGGPGSRWQAALPHGPLAPAQGLLCTQGFQ